MGERETALGTARRLLGGGRLSDAERGAIDAMWAGGERAGLAALAVRARPGDGGRRAALLRELTAHGHRVGAPGTLRPDAAELCERRAAARAYVRLAPETPLGRALDRWLRARPPDADAEHAGLRYRVVGSTLREGALTVRLRVDNASPVAVPLRLERLRLERADGSLAAPEAIAADALEVPAGTWHEARVRFSDGGIDVAAGAVLVLPDGPALAIDSEAPEPLR